MQANYAGAPMLYAAHPAYAAAAAAPPPPSQQWHTPHTTNTSKRSKTITGTNPYALYQDDHSSTSSSFEEEEGDDTVWVQLQLERSRIGQPCEFAMEHNVGALKRAVKKEYVELQGVSSACMYVYAPSTVLNQKKTKIKALTKPLPANAPLPDNVTYEQPLTVSVQVPSVHLPFQQKFVNHSSNSNSGALVLASPSADTATTAVSATATATATPKKTTVEKKSKKNQKKNTDTSNNIATSNTAQTKATSSNEANSSKKEKDQPITKTITANSSPDPNTTVKTKKNKKISNATGIAEANPKKTSDDTDDAAAAAAAASDFKESTTRKKVKDTTKKTPGKDVTVTTANKEVEEEDAPSPPTKKKKATKKRKSSVIENETTAAETTTTGATKDDERKSSSKKKKHKKSTDHPTTVTTEESSDKENTTFTTANADDKKNPDTPKTKSKKSKTAATVQTETNASSTQKKQRANSTVSTTTVDSQTRATADSENQVCRSAGIDVAHHTLMHMRTNSKTKSGKCIICNKRVRSECSYEGCQRRCVARKVNATKIVPGEFTFGTPICNPRTGARKDTKKYGPDNVKSCLELHTEEYTKGSK